MRNRTSGLGWGVAAVGILGVGLVSCTAQAEAMVSGAAMGGEAPQVKDNLFAGTEKFSKNASDVTEVNLDPQMLNAVGEHGKSDNRDFARKMDFVVVHSYTYDKPGMYEPADLEEFRQRLGGNGWKCFVHERSKKESSDICQRPGSDSGVNELAIMTAEPKELTFVHMKGHMSLNEMAMKGQMASMTGGSPMMMPFLLNGVGGSHGPMSGMPPSVPNIPNPPAPPNYRPESMTYYGRGKGDGRSFAVVNGNNVQSFGDWRDGEKVQSYAHSHPGHYIVFLADDGLHRLDKSDKLGEVDQSLATMAPLSAQQKELSTQMKPLSEQMRNLSAQMQQASGNASEQSRIGAEMSQLGRQQGELGRKQGELGRRQGEIGRELYRKVQEMLRDCMRDGSCPKVSE